MGDCQDSYLYDYHKSMLNMKTGFIHLLQLKLNGNSGKIAEIALNYTYAGTGNKSLKSHKRK